MKLHKKAYDIAQKFIIALDGPSAAGKGMIGKLLAQEFCLEYVQSSLVYRGLAYTCIKDNISFDDIANVIKQSEIFNLDLVENVDLNKESIALYASKISTMPQVRENLGKYLIAFIETYPRIIMEGRDIGTIIIPTADLKIFIHADVEIRAKRRYNQLQVEEKECTMSDILQKMKERDARDASRKVAPLIQAKDALVIDTTLLTPDQIVQNIKDYVSKF